MTKKSDVATILGTVFIVSYQREPTACHLHADLVRATCVERDPELGYGSVRVVLLGRERFVVEDRLLDPATLTVDDVGLVLDAVVIEQIDEGVRFLLRLAVHHREIDLLQGVRLYRGRKTRGGSFAFGIDHHTAHSAVESVDDPDVAAVLQTEQIGKTRLVSAFLGNDANRLANDENEFVLI